jgi:endonuclease/exonuclease/phosphatase family metal-dependent hydrolase
MSQLRQDFLRTIEAGIVGLFFVQAVRFLYATLYARASSADLVQRVADPALRTGKPGVVELATVQGELVVLVLCLLLPLLALIIGRWRVSFPLAVILVALGRSMAMQTADLRIPAASLVIGAGLLYLALTVIRRPGFFPSVLLLGFTGDQIIRALDNTWDHTWQNEYQVAFGGSFDIEMGVLMALVSIAVILFTILVWYVERRAAAIERRQEGYAPPLGGQMDLWGGLALGAFLYLEFTLLGLPNAVAHWSDTSYAALVPWLLTATTLPLVPEVRGIARRFAGMFDGAWRGWLWALLLSLLIVVGRRFDGIPAAVALVITQFLAGLTLWWLVHTGLPRRNPTGLMILVAVIGFSALAVGDYFTYDYAYVRNLADPYQNVSKLLRSFRNMGLGLTLIAALFMSVPMILARRRIPWRGGRATYTFFGLTLVLTVSFGGATAAMDNIVRRPANADCLRIGTFNIHGGYSEFFDPNLDRVAELIQLNGMDIVLLQEVDTGRLASFGVDQVMWLARRLDMESAFFAQNEALEGIAVLSRVPITGMQGLELPSQGNQAAVMHVELDPDRLVADPNPPGRLHIYNAWLGFREAQRNGQPVPDGEQDQNIQLQTMLNWIAANHAPAWTDRIILGGTFNFGPDSPLYTALDNLGLLDPFVGLRFEDTMTVYLVDGTAARYDYLWTFNLPLTGAAIDHSAEAANASDHRAAIVAVSRRDGVTCAP